MTLVRFQMCIDGQWLDAQSGKTFDSLDPATAKAWAQLPDAGEADVELAVQAAPRAFDSRAWRSLTATARGKLLRRLGDLIAQNKEHLAQLESRDNGKLIRETRGQVGYLPEFFHYTAGLADKLEGGTLPLDKPDLFAYTVHEPIGVVAGIIPWNSPLYLTAIKLAPALAAGNTIDTAQSVNHLSNGLWREELDGLGNTNTSVVNVVTGYGPSTGAALTRHPLVRKIAFTGSTEVGQAIMRAAAGSLKRLSLELGGKSPLIIFEDADPEAAAEAALWAIFSNSGQNCVAGSRLFVQRSLYQDVLQRLARRSADLKVGAGLERDTQIGPLISSQQLERVLHYVEGSRGSAELVAGGERVAGRLASGYFLQPTVFGQVSDDSPIASEEIFGPVLSVFAFDTEEEVLARANATRFGLAAGVWTNHLARAHRVAAQLRAGVVWVNTYDWFDPSVPFGGMGQSGIGRELGTQVLEMYTELKSVWIRTE